jgi:hypothetical protein
MTLDEVMRRAALGGAWRSPDLREMVARAAEQGRDERGMSFQRVAWQDGSATLAVEIAGTVSRWEPIGEDVEPPLSSPRAGWKRWWEEMARLHCGVNATARHHAPGAILIELACEPRRDSVGAFLEATGAFGHGVAVTVEWKETREVLDHG